MVDAWVQAFIGLGSNLGEPIRQVNFALQALGNLRECRLLQHSNLYSTPPLGSPDQPNYINAVALLETRLTPLELLDQLLNIEQQQGRIRSGRRWESRTMDLDLLLYGKQSMVHPRLLLPHPHMHQRAFVLVPLRELVTEDLEIPGAGLLVTLLQNCDTTGVERLNGVTIL